MKRYSTSKIAYKNLITSGFHYNPFIQFQFLPILFFLIINIKTYKIKILNYYFTLYHTNFIVTMVAFKTHLENFLNSTERTLSPEVSSLQSILIHKKQRKLDGSLILHFHTHQSLTSHRQLTCIEELNVFPKCFTTSLLLLALSALSQPCRIQSHIMYVFNFKCTVTYSIQWISHINN